MIRAIEAAGHGVEQAPTLREARALLRLRWYRLIAAEADDILVRWLVPEQGGALHGVPMVIWEVGEVVSLPGVPVPTVITAILCR